MRVRNSGNPKSSDNWQKIKVHTIGELRMRGTNLMGYAFTGGILSYSRMRTGTFFSSSSIKNLRKRGKPVENGITVI